MAIKMILAPVRGDGKGESVLGLAVAIAERFDGHVDVVHVHAKPEDLLPFGVPIPGMLRQTILDAVAGTASQEAAYLKGLFRQFCAARDLAEVDRSAAATVPGRVTVSWLEASDKQAEVIARLGRLADLIVVAKPERGGALGRNSLEAALFDVGKLTAVAPHGEIATVGRNVAVAWNASAEAGRAVALALPILAVAEKVIILAAAGDHPAELGVDDLCRYLGRHGVGAEPRLFRARPREVGRMLLAEALQAGADSIVMGAYGDVKRRELVLGSVTQYLLDNADLPILMAH